MRSAYARLIKVYRPDRAPDEFQRIQAAYEVLTGAAQRARVASVRTVRVEGTSLIDVILASEPPVVADAPDIDDRLRQVVADPSGEAAEAIAEALLADRAWWVRAHADHEFAVATWRVVAALAWLVDVEELRALLVTLPAKRNTDVDIADIDIACAQALRRYGDGIPSELARAMVTSWLDPGESLEHAATHLLAAVRADPERFFALFSSGLAPAPNVAKQLEARLATRIRPERREPSKLPYATGDVLRRGLRQARLSVVGRIAIAASIALAAITAWAFGAEHPDALAFLGATVGALAITALITLPGSYERCRVAFATAAAEVGITVRCIDHYLKSRPWELPLLASLHRPAMIRDEAGLRALAATAAWAASLAETGPAG